LSLHVLDPALEERRERHASGVDLPAFLHLRDQASALDLCLSFGAGEGMPAALACAVLRIAHVDDDGPMAGRPFADVALHF
jgi:hypothetical protein